MAQEKNHDYHVLPPSHLPFLGAVGAFVMLLGSVLWMHDMTPVPTILGLMIVLYTMFVWWREMVRESRAGDHTPVVQIGLRYGMILFIASEVMFFSAWFWTFFKHAIFPMAGAMDPGVGVEGVWPPVGIETFDPWHLPFLNTVILLLSGCTLTWAHHALLEGDRKGLINGLTLTVILGALFSAFQVYEYTHAAFSFGENIYSATFFMATGFHGAHVLIGTIFLLVCLVRALNGQFSPQKHVGFEAAAWYWHFVDVVWLFLFAGIYIWGA